jgi:hypothetical protein
LGIFFVKLPPTRNHAVIPDLAKGPEDLKK